MKSILAFVLGLVIGWGAGWYAFSYTPPITVQEKCTTCHCKSGGMCCCHEGICLPHCNCEKCSCGK